jgi:hypothetical protein
VSNLTLILRNQDSGKESIVVEHFENYDLNNFCDVIDLIDYLYDDSTDISNIGGIDPSIVPN